MKLPKGNPVLNISNEEWRRATRLHEVSNKGSIRNLSGRPLKPWIGTTGYLTLKMHIGGVRKNIKLHRLVAQTFIPNPHNLPCVNHIDGNKLNNEVGNLEWCTHESNMRHASKTGLIKKHPRTTGKKLSQSSDYHNVTWDKGRQRWVAGVTHQKKVHMQRRFKTEKEAALHVNHILDTMGLHDRPRNVVD